MKKIYRIFVSSTKQDLLKEREKVIQTILRKKHLVLCMETFNSVNRPPWELCMETIDQADYFILILAGKYGSINKQTQNSFCEDEYNYAKSKQIPILVFMIDESIDLPSSKTDNGEMKKRLNKFKEKIKFKGETTYQTWKNADELSSLVSTSLDEAFERDERVGLVASTELNCGIKTYGELDFDLNRMLLSTKKGGSVYITGITTNGIWNKINIFNNLLENGVTVNVLLEKDTELLSKMCDFFFTIHKRHDVLKFHQDEVHHSIYSLTKLQKFNEYYNNGLIHFRSASTIITTSCIGVDIDKDYGQIQAVFYQYGKRTDECPAVMLKCSDQIGKTISTATIDMWNDGVPIDLI